MSAAKGNKYAAKEVKAEKALRAYVVADLHARFKAACKDRQISQSKAMAEMVESFLRAHEQEQLANAEREPDLPGKSPQQLADEAAKRRELEAQRRDKELAKEDEKRRKFNGHTCKACGWGMYDLYDIVGSFPPKKKIHCSNCTAEEIVYQ